MYKIEIGRKRLWVILVSAGLLVILMLWATVQPAAVHDAYRPAYLIAWGETYTSSTSNDAGCQMCHQGAGGGDGWNAYGWNMRQLLLDDSTLTATQVFASIESADADGDGSSNVDEINASTQPGWTEGDTNTIFFSDGTTLADQAPPDAIGTLDSEATHVSLGNQEATATTWLPLFGLFMLMTTLIVGKKRTQ